MLDVRALKAEMARNDYTQVRLAAELGISPRTLSNKLKSGEFGNKEMEIMMDKLQLKDPMAIFFGR
jgi:transcriptional regulator with XRE-family HTH domain